jgi:hypothetical protein
MESNKSDKLYYCERQAMVLATNVFIDVPVVLQYENTPLIQFVKEQGAGYATEIPIYHSDGTYLAKVKGSRLFLTKEGEKAGVTLSHPDKMTVCKLADQILFEIRREDAAALNTKAELYTPDGNFLKCIDAPALFDATGNGLRIGGAYFVNNSFHGCRIGIWVKRNSLSFGVH